MSVRRKPKTDRHYNGQNKKTNNCLQNIHIKLKTTYHPDCLVRLYFRLHKLIVNILNNSLPFVSVVLIFISLAHGITPDIT